MSIALQHCSLDIDKCRVDSPIEKQLLKELLADKTRYAIYKGISIETQRECLTQGHRYRVDFYIEIEHECGKTGFVIECDGHDFHEKTKEQAKEDSQRDRNFLKDGIYTIRFTGSEIYNNSRQNAEEIFEIIDSIIQRYNYKNDNTEDVKESLLKTKTRMECLRLAMFDWRSEAIRLHHKVVFYTGFLYELFQGDSDSQFQDASFAFWKKEWAQFSRGTLYNSNLPPSKMPHYETVEDFKNKGISDMVAKNAQNGFWEWQKQWQRDDRWQDLHSANQ